MPSKKLKLPAKSALDFRAANKDRRKLFHVQQRRARDALKRDRQFARKRAERKDPELREKRRAENVPDTLDSKRKWDEWEDEANKEEDEVLGRAVDLVGLAKRRKMEEAGDGEHEADEASEADGADGADGDEMDEDMDEEVDDQTGSDWDDDSMLGDESDSEEDNILSTDQQKLAIAKPDDGPPPPLSTMADEVPSLAPTSLVSKFPTLFDAPAIPKILVTTSLNSTLHAQAEAVASLFPNASYVRRSAHRFGHKYSIREISRFAANRGFTALLVLMEDQKRPCGLDVVHLPAGPMFHFSLTSWMEGRKLPGHGNPTDHQPELILHGFRTPLGVLAATLFRTLYPSAPEVQGRQVVTLKNQRDYIFVRRHRYGFRDKRATEKSVLGADGKPVRGVEDIRAGLQELGPRFTLKLRRVDKGIQRMSGQEWEWKGRTDRVRTKFQL
jgi:ribosome production factor 1